MYHCRLIPSRDHRSRGGLSWQITTLAALFVVVHLSPRVRSYLPEILTKAGNLSAIHAEDNMPIRPGRIYVALPDYHLIVERDHVHVSVGPKEQHERPNINATFRSAALAYGERGVGVVLTGKLHDGTAGLWEISAEE